MMKSCLFFLILSFSSLFVFSQEIKNHDDALSKLEKRGEVYFKFKRQNFGVPFISKIVSIDKVLGDSIFAYANENEFSKFVLLNLPFEVIDSEGETYIEEHSNTKSAWSYYPTYSQYETLMQNFAANYPQFCRLVNLGTLSSGRKILALRISDNPDSLEAEPRFFYTSTMHGDEVTGYNFLLRFTEILVQGYGVDSFITQLVDSVDIWINPNANPDGTYYGGNNSVSGARRYNANNVDLNRNYPDPNSQHPDGNAYQPETMIFMGFADTMNFTMSANFHGGAEVVNYPWDTWSDSTADDSWWYFVSKEYADTVHFYSNYNGYMTNPYSSGITNGYAWYTMDGSRQDYMNYFKKCREATLEISNYKILQTNKLDTTWYYSKNAFFNYLNQVRFGLRGIITDSATNEPLKAKVFISGHDIDSSHVWSNLPHGDYYRLLDSGYYNVTYSSQGYYSKTISVHLNRYGTTIQDVQLAEIIDFVGENVEKDFKIYPNPTTSVIKFEGDFDVESYEIYDLQGRCVMSGGNFENGNKTISITVLQQGFYILKIVGGGKIFQSSLIKQ